MALAELWDDTFRTLHINGSASEGAAAVVEFDGVIVHAGPVVGPRLFSSITSVTRHGVAEVRVWMKAGAMVIRDVTVTYPALFNDEVRGFVTFAQPIEHPLRHADDPAPLALPLEVGNVLRYRHLMFNGPLHWAVTLNDSLRPYEGMHLVLPDIFASGSTSVTQIQPDWGYEWIRFRPENPADIQALLAL